MDAITQLKDIAGRPLEALDRVWADLDPARLNEHPGGHPNSPAWLLWHTAREIDAQVAHLSGYEEVWHAAGFEQRFDLPAVISGSEGYGQTAVEAREVRVSEDAAGKALLRDYLEAVLARVQTYLDGIGEGELDRVVDESYSPPVTAGVRLISVFDDAAQHLGQVGYITGMQPA